MTTITQKEFLDGAWETMQAGEGECWPFPADPTASIRVRMPWGDLIPLRRYAYMHFMGEDMPLPASGQSSNRCGTRKCINPAHYRRVDE